MRHKKSGGCGKKEAKGIEGSRRVDIQGSKQDRGIRDIAVRSQHKARLSSEDVSFDEATIQATHPSPYDEYPHSHKFITQMWR